VLERFDERCPLRRHRIAVFDRLEAPASMRAVRLSDRILAFLRGDDTMDELVQGVARISTELPPTSAIVLPPDVIEQIRRAITVPTARVVLVGQPGTGRALLVEAVFAELKRPAIRIELAPEVSVESMIAALRETVLRNGVAIVEAANIDELARPLRDELATAATNLAIPIVFVLDKPAVLLAHAVHGVVEIAVPPPSYRQRFALWQLALPPPLAYDKDLEVVASRYAFTAAAIMRAARRAATHARLRDPDDPQVSLDELTDAARLMFSHRLGSMAERVPTGFTWDDLVVPPDTLDALREVVRFAHNRAYLLEEWGFAKKLPYGRGVSAILAGPPGTGKTMVAQLLAKELGYDLYRIDLSQVVNKYIGETEKNLARLFDEAESSHAVLFFDEADSLFAKRTDVRSSNDRYANLEVNYLLQRMETYNGVTLLATNLEQGLDDAFKRRVRFSIQFELPDEEQRERLWQSMFPSETPLSPQIEWKVLAQKFEMAGGYIKKAALRAALFAVEQRRPITMEDLLAAARQEYREMGRII
jgi:SpoVK/Ycf46/Vps4 family AAA+-type ATPase